MTKGQRAMIAAKIFSIFEKNQTEMAKLAKVAKGYIGMAAIVLENAPKSPH